MIILTSKSFTTLSPKNDDLQIRMDSL